MSRRATWVAVAVGLAPVVGACSGSDWDPDPTPIWTEGQGTRAVAPLVLDTLFHIHGRDDATLVDPSLLRATPHGIAVLDRIDQEVSLYSEEGARLWTSGGKGQGPGEFENVRDLRATEDDRLIVYDVGNGKVTELDARTGALRSELRLPEHAGIAESMVPLGDSVLLVTFRPEQPLALVSLSAGRVETYDMPWQGFRNLHALHRQGITAVDGRRWAYLFRYGNGFFAFDGAAPLDYLGQYVEHQPFPALSVSVTSSGRSISFVDQPVCSACSASLVSDTLFVHFGGDTDHAARVLDAYDLVTGAYIRSYRLPTFFAYVEVGPDWIAGVRRDPFPELILLTRGRAEGEAP